MSTKSGEEKVRESQRVSKRLRNTIRDCSKRKTAWKIGEGEVPWEVKRENLPPPNRKKKKGLECDKK